MNAVRVASLILTVLIVVGVGRAADKPSEEKTGLRLNAKAPAFTLKDQNGKERTLDEFLKKGKVALVFHRSAGW